MTPTHEGTGTQAGAWKSRGFDERSADERIADELERCARLGTPAASERLHELDHEWDTDRVIETEVAMVGLVGLALGAFWRRELLVLPALVAANMLVHARTGHYPLSPVLRRLGFRTAREIERERHALKALRGDYSPDDTPAPASRGAPGQSPATDGGKPSELH